MTTEHAIPILVVEDFRTMSRIICDLLKQIGFENVDTASDGADALVKMRAKTYRLVVSDWNMEPISGYDLLRHIRGDDALSGTRVIIVTAESSVQNVIDAKRAGVDSYIIKPFNADALKTKIKDAFTH